jgi:hypothetical protein
LDSRHGGAILGCEWRQVNEIGLSPSMPKHQFAVVCCWQWVDASADDRDGHGGGHCRKGNGNILARRVVQGAVGVTIAGAFLLYVTRPSVRFVFGAKSN